MQYFQFEPIYKERIWGGQQLAAVFNRKIKGDQLIGESWEIVDRPSDQSIVVNGPLAGQSLEALLQTSGKAILGPRWTSGRFPILVKWLDCQERLSLQVHPPHSVAHHLQGEPKAEHWYVAESKQGSGLLLGLKASMSPEDFRQATLTETLEPYFNRVEISEHDSIFVPSGRLHGIEGGCLILEIQQNSDTTYRVYDWKRTGADGKPRELHLDAALQAIDFTDVQPSVKKYQPGTQVLAETTFFRLRQIELDATEQLFFPHQQEPKIISLIKGEIKIHSEEGENLIPAGTNLLLPYEGSFNLEAKQNSLLLITDNII